MTGESDDELSGASLLSLLAALANPQRFRLIAELAKGRAHVSELARRLGVSRPLLYLHLKKLEAAGVVAGSLELSGDGKAMKFFTLVPFDLQLTSEGVARAASSLPLDDRRLGG